MLRRDAALGAFALALLWGGAARADEERWQRRGLMRGGMALTTAGISSSISSAALLISTEGRLGLEAGGMLVAGQVLLAAGVPMWAVGAPGRETRPENAPLRYAGLALAGLGLIGLPVSSGLLAASLDFEDSEPLVIAGIATAAGAHLVLIAGIPMWAIGARSPDDRFLSITVGPGTIQGSF
jgi:hypothetical protein